MQGFSNKTNEHVYPNETWSWTSWTSRITNTYKSFQQAKRAISSGYLKEMIEQQEIVDIVIYEVVKVTESVENKKIRVYSLTADAPDYFPRKFVEDEYVIINDGKIYGHITSIKDDVAYIWVVNGGWQLVLDMSGDTPIVHPESDCDDHSMPIEIDYIGVPDPTMDKGDYDWQIEFYRENLANQFD